MIFAALAYASATPSAVKSNRSSFSSGTSPFKLLKEYLGCPQRIRARSTTALELNLSNDRRLAGSIHLVVKHAMQSFGWIGIVGARIGE
jgi:hypothetical protein